MQRLKKLSPLEEVLFGLQVASTAVKVFGLYGNNIFDKSGRPLIDRANGVVVLNDETLYEFTLAVKFYESLPEGHPTRKLAPAKSVHDSYDNVRAFYHSEKFAQIKTSHQPKRKAA